MTANSGNSGSSALKAWVRALEMTAPIARQPELTLPVLMSRLGERFGDAPALIDDDGALSFRALAERVNRYARWALECGIGPGDVVCLMMGNCSEYFAAWLGITRTGATVALINVNLLGDSLAHAINIVAPGHVVVGSEFAGVLDAIRSKLEPSLRCWAHGAADGGFCRVDQAVCTYGGEPLDAAECPLPSVRERALYIYTSGTTGLPKAANVSHYRLMQWSHWFAGMAETESSDRMYNCLPMYHSVGGIVALGATLVAGGSVVIRPRFSLSSFWDEIVRWNCTLFQYIGELCRYLVNGPAHPREREHKLRLCCGNGLRPDVWEPFKERFRIPRILEFYAATEANFSLYNCEGKPGAIGRIPSFLAHRVRVVLIEIDPATNEPVRGEDGFCVRCATDRPGEAISEIRGRGNGAGGQFEGYTDASASAKKILRDVFAPGDAWYRSGDLMRRDRAGFFYFVDRVGATFRWKGENVSTTEVTEAICGCSGVEQAIVYGVSVPDADGRAGMAALVVNDRFELGVLRQQLAQRLPDYACPLFLRILSRIETTGTFKPKAQDYVQAGYDPAATPDPLYVYDRETGAYVDLDRPLFDRIRSGAHRL